MTRTDFRERQEKKYLEAVKRNIRYARSHNRNKDWKFKDHSEETMQNLRMKLGIRRTDNSFDAEISSLIKTTEE